MKEVLMEAVVSNTRFPKVHIRDLKDDYLKFELTDTDSSMANALRRIMIAEVPTLAIDIVEIEKNSSVLNDEFLAHRVGLIPLRSEKAMGMPMYEDCHDCDGRESCTYCSVEFTLAVKCASDERLDVTTHDLISSHPSVVPVHNSLKIDLNGVPDDKGILILRLGQGQELKLRAIARKGIGRDHAKWSPAATVTFQYEPEIHINQALMETLTLEEKEEWIDSSPTKVFAIEEGTQKVVVHDAEAYTYDEEVLRKAEAMGKPGLVEIIQREDKFIFTVESTGAISAAQIFLDGITILKNKLNDVRLSSDTLEPHDQSGAHLPG